MLRQKGEEAVTIYLKGIYDALKNVQSEVQALTTVLRLVEGDYKLLPQSVVDSLALNHLTDPKGKK